MKIFVLYPRDVYTLEQSEAFDEIPFDATIVLLDELIKRINSLSFNHWVVQIKE